MGAQWLKDRRRELHLSQDDLTARLQLAGLDITRAALSHWETGRDNAPLENRKALAAIANALELTPNELLTLAGHDKEDERATHSDAARHGAIIIDRLPPEAQKTAVDQLRALERLFARSGN